MREASLHPSPPIERKDPPEHSHPVVFCTPTGRALAQALGPGVLDALPIDRSAKRRRAVSLVGKAKEGVTGEEETLPQIEAVASDWGIPEALFRAWQARSFPQVLSHREVLEAVRLQNHSSLSISVVEAGVSERRKPVMVVGVTRSVGDAAEVMLFSPATAGEGGHGNHSPMDDPDRSWDDKIRTLYHIYARVLVQRIPAAAKAPLERLWQGARAALLSEKSSHAEAPRSITVFPSNVDGWLTMIAEEAFQVYPTDHESLFRKAIEERLLTRLRRGDAALRTAVSRMLEVFFQALVASYPDFSFWQTAQDRYRGIEDMRRAHRRHSIETLLAQLESFPELEEALFHSFSKSRDEWSLGEQVAVSPQEAISASERAFLERIFGTDEERAWETIAVRREIQEDDQFFSLSGGAFAVLTRKMRGGREDERQGGSAADAFEAITAWDRARASLRALRRGLDVASERVLKREDFLQHYRALAESIQAFVIAWRRLTPAQREYLHRPLHNLNQLYEGDDSFVNPSDRARVCRILGQTV